MPTSKSLSASAALALTLLILEGAGATGSGSPPDTLSLEDKVVTATRTFRKPEELPRAVNFVTGRDLGERLPRTSAEALREEAGIQVQKTEHGGGSAIIRGMGSSQVLLLVDGMRLNNGTYRFGNHPYMTTVDFGMLDRIEVVRGPGSTLYGSDAMGGTVNMITRNPDFSSDGLRTGGRIQARYATSDNERIARAEADLSGRAFALTAGASIKDAGDLRRGSNGLPWGQGPRVSGITQENSGYSGYDYDAKLVASPASNQRLTLGWQATARPEIPRYDRYEDPGFHRWNYTDQERRLAFMNYDWSGKDVPLPIRAFVSWQSQEEGRHFQRRAASGSTREWAETRTLGFGLQTGYRWGMHAWSLGGEAYLDRISSRRDLVDTSGKRMPALLGLYPDGSAYDSYGAFLQDEMRLGRLAVTLGARYSLVSMEYDIPLDTAMNLDFGTFENGFQALSGSAGLAYNPVGNLHLSVNVAQGFRAPNLSDVARNGETRNLGGGVLGYEIPNPDLRPERLMGYEAGIRWKSGRLQSALHVFFSDLEDALDTRTALLNGDSIHLSGGSSYKMVSKQNVGRVRIHGVEWQGSARLVSNLWAYGNAAWTRGDNLTLDEAHSGIPPAYGLTGLRWSAERCGANLFSRFAGDMRRLSLADRADARIPQTGEDAAGNPIRRSLGWYTVNLRGEYRPNGALALRGGVENIMDVNYREHGSGINAPGRNFIASLEYSH